MSQPHEIDIGIVGDTLEFARWGNALAAALKDAPDEDAKRAWWQANERALMYAAQYWPQGYARLVRLGGVIDCGTN